jgi:hypothetical protein
MTKHVRMRFRVTVAPSAARGVGRAVPELRISRVLSNVRSSCPNNDLVKSAARGFENTV